MAVLQNAMSAEIICILYYTNLSVSAIGLRRPQLGREFQAQANDERKHMESMARRIRALGGIPDYHPPDLGNWGTSTANITQSFISIFRQNLEVEQLMVALYHDLLKYFAGRDLETTILLNIIMQDEENHIADLKDLLKE